MPVIEFNKKRLIYLVGAVAGLYIFYELFRIRGHGGYSKSSPVGLPNGGFGWTGTDGDPVWDGFDKPVASETPFDDSHPIQTLMADADARWRQYETSRSTSFRQVVEKYRSKYGRHPPPGFKDWYKFARDKNVWNIDDFDHIMDDMRPFWAIDAKELRTHTSHMHEDFEHGIAVIHIRNHKIVKVHNEMWRTDVMTSCIKKFIKYLPDMDIPMNRLDQPRVVVPWEAMQELLQREYDTRIMPPDTFDEFSLQQEHLWNENLKDGQVDETPRLEAGWFNAAGRQYMDIASKACPPESPARNPAMTIADADKLYKEPLGGIVTNFNLSSDLCTVGPTIQNLHGMLYSASSILASHKLVPIFGECKTNINNDIMFPANMYYKHDDRYDYSDVEDVPWREKRDTLVWRGVTSGGVQIAENWSTMHRQRLVSLLNGTFLAANDSVVNVLGLTDPDSTKYTTQPFHPSHFAQEHTDVGFVKAMSCVPDCHFYDDVYTWVPEIPMASHFKSRFLIDVDGHSFSGRWHAFLQSKSLGFKATIFREWHDSRLFAWRHFVPVDNRYDDLYSLFTYFTGYDPQEGGGAGAAAQNPSLRVPMHDEQAQTIARQGREWANKVLRRDDIEVYTFRLLLEYARVLDDNRDRIGYGGDGTELDHDDGGGASEASGLADAGSRLGFGRIWDGLKGSKKVDATASSSSSPDHTDREGEGDRWGFGRGPPAVSSAVP